MPKRLCLRRFRRNEKQTPTMKLHDRKLPTWAMHRYQIIAQVRAGSSVFQAMSQVNCAVNTAYLWVKRFNQSGFKFFESSSHPEGRVLWRQTSACDFRGLKMCSSGTRNCPCDR